jgi:hypothetical protein
VSTLNPEQLKRNLIRLAGAATPSGILSNPDSADLEFIERSTTGDAFKRLAEETLRAIRSLPETLEFFERIFVGPFGSGKTHMGLLLYKRLKRDDDQLLITFDFSRLANNSDDFEYVIVTGMRTGTGYGYQQAFRHLFDRIIDRLNVNFRQKNTSIAKAFLYHLYRYVSDSQAGLSQVIGELVERNFGDEIKTALRNGTLNQLIGQYQQQTSHEFGPFVEALSDLVANPDTYGGEFEEKLKSLSAKGVLTDIVFKLVKAAGYKRIVMIGDELETLAKSPPSIPQILTVMRSFRDEYIAKTRTGGEYPAVALILFSNTPFLDQFVEFEPALWSRWHYHVVALPPPDIEQAVETFETLALQAHLIDTPVNKAEIIGEIIPLPDSEQPEPTMREVIHDILQLLRTKYSQPK